MARSRSAAGFGEFVALMALMTSLVALSIDAMLPALPEIGKDLGVQRENDPQLIVSFLFVGMAIGQMVYGPLSDSTGRKPPIYAGLGLYMMGCLLSLLATSFSLMLVGRVLQGMGLAGPRVVSIALVRDQYEGRAMARVMSFVMAVFILVPAVAPALGQGILLISHWRVIFAAFLALGLIVAIWFALRQPETLEAERRIPFSLKRIWLAVREVCRNRIAFGYTLAAGSIFGAFLGYLSSAQQVFQEHYGLGARFPLFFAVLALSIGCAALINSRLVMRFGMRALTGWSLATLSLLSVVFFAFSYRLGGSPPLWEVMIYFILAFFCMGILFGNLNALAMGPLGHIAVVGAAVVGAAVVGSLSTLISMPLGTLIGQSYNGTILPLVGGFALLSATARIAMGWAERKKLESQ